MRINTNVNSLTAQESSTNTQKRLSSSLEKLGSGLAINKAADDASGMAIADKLRTQASSIGQGISNANSASALIQIADKAMSEQSNILDIVKGKLIQASTDTTTDAGREAIRKDVGKLLEQFDNIASQTNYNGITLLQQSSTDDSKADELTFQLGEDSTFDVSMSSSNASNTAHLGGGSVTLDTVGGSLAATSGGDGYDNNLGQNSSQQIATSGTVSLQSMNVEATGFETASSLMDITLQGDVNQLTSTSTDLNIDFRNETQAIQDAIASLVDSTADLDFSSSGKVSIAAGVTLDLTDSAFDNLSQVNVQSLTGAESDLTVGDGNAINFTVTNNAVIDGKPSLSNINISTSAAATGGRLLEDLKNISEAAFTNEAANNYMETIDQALTQVNTSRADFGSSQNQIESSLRNMQTTRTNLMAAESVIRDVDYAAESASFNKQNIIAQAGTYAMSQANAIQQGVQKLLQ